MSSFNEFTKRLQYLEEAKRSFQLPLISTGKPGKLGPPGPPIKRRITAAGVPSAAYHSILFLARVLIDDGLQPTGPILSDEEHSQIEMAKVPAKDPEHVGGASGMGRKLHELIAKHQKEINSITNFQEIVDKNLDSFIARIITNSKRKKDEFSDTGEFTGEAEVDASAIENEVEKTADEIKQGTAAPGPNAKALADIVDADTAETYKASMEDPTTMIVVNYQPLSMAEQMEAFFQRLFRNESPEKIEIENGAVSRESDGEGSITVSLDPETQVAQGIANENTESAEETFFNIIKNHFKKFLEEHLERLKKLLETNPQALSQEEIAQEKKKYMLTYLGVRIIKPGEVQSSSGEFLDDELPGEGEEAEEFNTNSYLDVQRQTDAVTHPSQTMMIPHREYMKPKTIHQAITYVHGYGVANR
jgi:hypothetical protein